MDLAVLDMLDNFGVGDRVVGVSKGSSIDYLQNYVTNNAIINLGTIKEASLEAVMECEPDIIFIGGRLSQQYDELSQIAPVIFLTTDVKIGLVKSISENAMAVASIFGVEDRVSGLLAEYAARIGALAEVAQGKTAVVGMVNSGGFGVLGNDGRCSIIGVEVGFENIGLSAVSSNRRGSGGNFARGGGGSSGNGGGSSHREDGPGGSGGTTAVHGNEASFEVLVSLNPDYIFVMDRDAAIGTGGARLAQEVMDNELVAMTEAYKNDNIIILKHSNVWYTAEGGITALGIMLTDLETALR
jgi:iron complex transport system substrate-binding protein